MKVSILSDLHCHAGKIPGMVGLDSMEPADVLVVAGDIAVADTCAQFVTAITVATGEKFRARAMVDGNHDYYTRNIDKDSRTPSVDDNHVVSVKEADGDRVVDFVCSTLWSPILEKRTAVRYGLNDYNYIPEFTINRCTDLFYENVEWLEREVAKCREAGHDVVIVTHHLPRRELIDPAYANSELNEAFCVLDTPSEKRLADLSPILWVHGHSHNFMDKTIDGIRYVRNPVGYEYTFAHENTGYRRNFIVEI
jgi:predicted phosphodiesterase